MKNFLELNKICSVFTKANNIFLLCGLFIYPLDFLLEMMNFTGIEEYSTLYLNNQKRMN